MCRWCSFVIQLLFFHSLIDATPFYAIIFHPFVLYSHSLSPKNPEHHQCGNVCIHTCHVRPCTHTQSPDTSHFHCWIRYPRRHHTIVHHCCIYASLMMMMEQTQTLYRGPKQKNNKAAWFALHMSNAARRGRVGFLLCEASSHILSFPTTLAWIGDTHSRSGW